ncbi:MAG: glutamine--fructose-6-phosphate transaminase (isomerizing) [Pseudomonadota bacterium]
MCGIIGAVAKRNVVPILIEGLHRLEYRGYDSAGLAVLDGQGLTRLRRLGKVAVLEEAVLEADLAGHTGIAHTRWATHGVPSERNAHPHLAAARIAVVHNGIIENHKQLREMLEGEGVVFESQTDTEVIPHLIERGLRQGLSLWEAFRTAVNHLEGAYALAVLDREAPGRLLAARQGSPLLLGVGVGERFVASDPSALIPVTSQLVDLHNGDLLDIQADRHEIFTRDGEPVHRPMRISQLDASSVDRGEYRHFMQKEIFEQPVAISRTLHERLPLDGAPLALGREVLNLLQAARAIRILACGTSYHAGLTAAYWFEAMAGLPCRVEVASEFRYRATQPLPGELVIAISQSGETADTLAAVHDARERGFVGILAICNVDESSLVRSADASLLTHAGPEIGVASTKAFTTQLVALALLVLAQAERQGTRPELRQALRSLPAQVEQILAADQAIEALSALFADKQHALFLGRGIHYPIALEGALKLKEISYIHAEGYPAGELKHGPLALVNEEMPVIAVAPNDALLEKLRSNLEEVRARGGQLIVFGEEGAVDGDGIRIHSMPPCHAFISPMLYIVPLQLLSYHVAVLKGTDVDRPRNLAKSVTVE